MERRHLVTVAGVATGALVVAAAAYALTFGALGQGHARDGAGTLAPVLAVTPVSTTVSTAVPPTAPAERRGDHDADRGHDDD